ncbi:MAG: serine hydrolase [Balneolaceae bacterium]
MKLSYLVLLALLLQANFTNAQTLPIKEVPVSVGEMVNDSLQNGSIHTYTIKVDSAQFVFGQANQKTVDVVVTVYDPDEEQVATFDGPGRGSESFQFDTETSGEYRIEIKPFEEETGEYSLIISMAEPTAKDPAGRVDQLMIEYTGDNVPGGAVMVMKDDEIIFSESYGMANLTYAIPFEIDTRHNIGSTSKQFTAFGITLLADQGRLSLDDDIRKYIPELPQFSDTVTLRNLLTHTSGYREFLNTLAMTGQDISSPVTQEKVIEIVQRQPELQNIPGEEFNYNNTGFVLMTIVVERVTDTPFPRWMKQNVFEPLGMNLTMVRENQSQVVPGRSQGYMPAEDGGYKEATDLGGAMGAGGIYTSVGDLANWIRNLNNPNVGNADIIEKMATPFELNNGSSTQYGLGLFLQEYKSLKYIHHGGADIAHRSMLMYFPEINAAVVTQSNYGSFRGDISQKVADVFFEEYFERQEDEPKEDVNEQPEDYDYNPENFDLLTGRYELSVMPGFILTFSREGDRIYTQATGQPEVDLKATSDSTFNLVVVNAAITFHLNADGSADSLTLHQNGNHLATRISWNPDIEELQAYTGQYFSEEIETLYHVEFEDKILVMKHYLLEDMQLTPGDEDSFSASFPIAEILFTRNENGEISGFNASNGRARGIFFEKVEF